MILGYQKKLFSTIFEKKYINLVGGFALQNMDQNLIRENI